MTLDFTDAASHRRQPDLRPPARAEQGVADGATRAPSPRCSALTAPASPRCCPSPRRCCRRRAARCATATSDARQGGVAAPGAHRPAGARPLSLSRAHRRGEPAFFATIYASRRMSSAASTRRWSAPASAIGATTASRASRAACGSASRSSGRSSTSRACPAGRAVHRARRSRAGRRSASGSARSARRARSSSSPRTTWRRSTG